MASVVRDERNRRILSAIASGNRVTQRSLAAELGIALGLANLLLHRLVKKGHVRVRKIGTRHVRYFMTKAGRDALAAATHLSLANTVHLYTETREMIRESLDAVSSDLETAAEAPKRIVLYGAGDVAEIAYISLQATDLTLIGVVDDVKRTVFLGYPVHDPSELTTGTLGGVPFDGVVVASVQHADKILARLNDLQVPTARVYRI